MNKKMRLSKKKTYSVISFVLALVIACSAIPLFVSSVKGVVSFDYIEQMKTDKIADGRAYTILEIVPDDNLGAMGYYAAGSEPFDYWKNELGSLSKEGRANYINGLKNKLKTAGLLGTSDCPLTEKTYTEYTVWQDNIPSDAVEISLSVQESSTATNSTFYEDNYGSYTANYEYKYKPSGVTWNYVYDILYYIYNDSAPAEGPFYGLVFSELKFDASAEDLSDGTYVYENVDAENNSGIDKPMKLVGCVSDGYILDENGKNIGLDIDTTYYLLEGATDPSETYSASTPYTGYSDGYRLAEDGETGYFAKVPVSFNYVGDGNGDFSHSSGTSSYTVYYSTVYAGAFYTNNNWFKQYVLDASASDNFSVYVESVNPAYINATVEKIYSADLIVITTGMDIDNPTAATAYQSDINSSVKDAIQSVCNETACPVLIDSAVCSTTQTNLKALCDSLCSGLASGTSGGAKNNVYRFNKSDSGAGNLAGSKFITAFTSNTSAYQEVASEIATENSTRSTGKLSTTLSPATTLRYIINYAGRVQVNNKDEIDILEIEPYTQAADAAAAQEQKCLTVSQVQSWFPEGTFADDKIHIHSMSASEYVGHIEDIVENYDLVYIGASTYNMNTTTVDGVEVPDYNDSDMDGMYYTNIGDTYRAVNGITHLSEYVWGAVLAEDHRNDAVLGGLLSKEYDSGHSGQVKASNYSNVASDYYSTETRLSGNDITATKLAELTEAVNAKIPVVVADELTLSSYEETLTAKIVVESTSGSSATLRVELNKELPEGVTYTCQWYKNGSTLLGTDRKITVSWESNTTYYNCKISLGMLENYTNKGIVRINTLSDFLTTNKVQILRHETQTTYAISLSSVSNGKFSVSATRNGSAYTPSGYSWFKWTKGSFWERYKTKWNNYSGNSSTITISGSSDNSKAACAVKFNTTEGGEFYLFDKNATPDWWNDANAYSGTPKTRTFYTYSYSTSLDNSSTSNTLRTQCIVDNFSVDNSSYWFQFLNTSLTCENVMAESEALAQKDNMLIYVNSSNPKIIMDESTVNHYSETNPESLSGNAIDVEFTLVNRTDLTPRLTTYTCKLFIDANADGVYSTDEEITNLTIENVRTNTSVNSDELTAGYKYRVYKHVPEEYAGAIPWRLEIVQNGSGKEYFHDSYIAYSYIEPEEPAEVKVLQIIRGSESTTAYSETAHTGSVFRSQIFKTILGTENVIASSGSSTVTLKVRNDFNIIIDITNVDSLPTDLAEVKTLMNNYQMLIVGFGEEYYKGITDAQAQAIAYFIDTGKPVLYSHDTTSYFNDLVGHSSIDNWKEDSGYYINRWLRSRLGLDRYGCAYVQTQMAGSGDITADGYVITSDGPSKSKSGIYEASAYSASTLSGLNYAVAYKPGSGRATTQLYVHGFSKNILARFKMPAMFEANDDNEITNWVSAPQYNPTKNGVYGDYEKFLLLDDDHSGTISGIPEGVWEGWNSKYRFYNWLEDDDYYDYGDDYYSYRSQFAIKTATATKVNSGQLTQYPFELGDTITVTETDEQYYQLNVNDPDVRVWYCLGGGNYSDVKNDCTNCYYIYSKGNIIYTGAGNTNAFTADEAKLFINTMLVAYTSVSEGPSVSFYNSNGTSEISSIVVNKTDADGNLTGTTVKFKVVDPNLEPTLSNNFSLTIKYYNTSGDLLMTTTESGKLDDLLEITIPSAVLASLNSSTDPTAEIKVVLEVTGYSKANPSKTVPGGSAELKIRKLQLLDLS